jgi:hypothetical protein
MCKFCFETEIHNFNSLSEFENFERELFSKKIRILESSKKKNTFLDFDVSYQCNNCLEIWHLSEPENAWRGYFLKENSAKKIIAKIKKSDLKKKCGFFFLLVIMLFLLLSFFN